MTTPDTYYLTRPPPSSWSEIRGTQRELTSMTNYLPSQLQKQNREPKRTSGRLERRNLWEPEDGSDNFFEEVVNLDFHSGSRGLSTMGFGTTPPVDILANLHCLYGKPSYQDLDAELLHLNNTMNIIQPVKVMLRGIKEVKIFLLANPN